MELLWQELSFGLPGTHELGQVLIRMLAAVLAGSVVGYEREVAGKAAGLRTHILVTLGTCVFVLAGAGYGMTSEGLSRVIQGIVTGLGFIGAGSILKLREERDIQGLTTAAGIWMTAAIGVTIGLGLVGLGMLSAVLTVIVLTVLSRLDVNTKHDPVKSTHSGDQDEADPE